MDELDAKIQHLVDDYFPWDSQQRPAAAAQRRTYVLAWLRQQTAPHRHAALGLVALVQPLLDELISSVPDHERSRFIARVDIHHMEKSPESILEKMARNFKHGTVEVGFRNLHEMDDLARFRIVTNFLSDIYQIRDVLDAPYRSMPGRQRSSQQEALFRQYELRRNHFDDLILKHPAERQKGERCLKGVFFPREAPTLRVEVQIMTMLQEAWDKKDHCLIYERRRRGHVIECQHEIEVFTLAEMLYGADLLFDQLRDRIAKQLQPSQTQPSVR